MKTRLFAVLLGLATMAVLVGIASAEAKKPKTPPPGTRGVVTKPGTPGEITITHFAPDGVTVLSTARVRATASDTSASVAARLGTSAPDAVKTGGVTAWDDAGRPDAPVAQVESAPDTRSTASARRHARVAECCSGSGCDEVEVTRDITGDVFGDWIGTFHHRVYWCWSYPRITGISVACWSTVDGSFVNDNGCSGWGNYYSWAGSGHGGHVSFRSGDWDNCVFHWGCFGNIYPWIEVWVNGNGAWAQDQGG